jgi:hypothetical protein
MVIPITTGCFRCVHRLRTLAGRRNCRYRGNLDPCTQLFPVRLPSQTPRVDWIFRSIYDACGSPVKPPPCSCDTKVANPVACGCAPWRGSREPPKAYGRNHLTYCPIDHECGSKHSSSRPERVCRALGRKRPSRIVRVAALGFRFPEGRRVESQGGILEDPQPTRIEKKCRIPKGADALM